LLIVTIYLPYCSVSDIDYWTLFSGRPALSAQANWCCLRIDQSEPEKLRGTEQSDVARPLLPN